MSNKNLAVRYTVRCGEYEFNGTTILTGNQNDADEDIVHDNFITFYDDVDEDDMEKASSYLYCAGEVGIKKINWIEITEEEKAVLNKVGI